MLLTLLLLIPMLGILSISTGIIYELSLLRIIRIKTLGLPTIILVLSLFDIQYLLDAIGLTACIIFFLSGLLLIADLPLTDGDIQDILDAIGRLFPNIPGLNLPYLIWSLYFLILISMLIRKYFFTDIKIELSSSGFSIGSGAAGNRRRRKQYAIWDSNDPTCTRLRLLYPQPYHLFVPAGVYNRYTGNYEERMVIVLGIPHHHGDVNQDFRFYHMPHIESRDPLVGNIPITLDIPAPNALIYLYMTSAGYNIQNMSYNITNPNVVTIRGIVLQVS